MDGIDGNTRLVEFERQTDLPMLVLSVLYAGILVAPALPIVSDYEYTLEAINWLLWGVFVVEFGIRLVLAPRHMHYAATHWYDVAIVALPFLRPLRAIRVLRLLRLISVGARVIAVSRRILASHHLGYVLLVAMITVFAAALAMLQVEHQSESASIHDFPTALWWAVTTVTTVGYGDTYPTTALGRGIAVVVMLLGISLFGLVTASVAAFFVSEDAAPDERDHAVILQRIEERLDRIEERMAEEAGQRRAPVVEQRAS